MEEMRKVSEAFVRMVGLRPGRRVSRVEFPEAWPEVSRSAARKAGCQGFDVRGQKPMGFMARPEKEADMPTPHIGFRISGQGVGLRGVRPL